MDTAIKTDALKKYLLAGARASESGLWLFNDVVVEALGVDRYNDARPVTMRIISELLGEDLLRAGLPKRDGSFEVWTQDAEEIIERIGRDWDALGEEEPNIGDVVWFVAAEKADEYLGDYSMKNSKLAAESAD
jgi:hypothetical protein